MSLTRLLIKDFRNIESADLALSPGFNFLVGANGSGKTSVLEAIYTLGHGRAFRSLQIGRVIRHEQEAFVLHVVLLALLPKFCYSGNEALKGSIKVANYTPTALKGKHLTWTLTNGQDQVIAQNNIPLLINQGTLAERVDGFQHAGFAAAVRANQEVKAGR